MADRSSELMRRAFDALSSSDDDGGENGGDAMAIASGSHGPGAGDIDSHDGRSLGFGEGTHGSWARSDR